MFVTAPPIEDAANLSALALLAKVLGTSKSSLSIITGEHCRDKVIRVKKMKQSEVLRILEINMMNK